MGDCGPWPTWELGQRAGAAMIGFMAVSVVLSVTKYSQGTLERIQRKEVTMKRETRWLLLVASAVLKTSGAIGATVAAAALSA